MRTEEWGIRDGICFVSECSCGSNARYTVAEAMTLQHENIK